jgi:RHS repeat-associated protein
VLNPNTQYTLKAFNGGLHDGQTELVSSGFVNLNGVQIIGPNNFNQNVAEVDVPVTLQGANTLDVQVRGQPGGVLTIEVIGVDNDPPTIQASISPAANAAGWNNTNVTVTFVCSDATSPVASCPGPTTVTTEGANQVVSGTATDAAGNSTSTSVTIKLDKTPPSIAITSPANGATVTASSLSVTGTVSDALSGVATVTCNGSPATVQSGSFSCSLTLTSGTNTITPQATDVAGNTSSTSENITLSNAPPPAINSFSPNSGPIGTQISLSGSNFTGGGPATPQVTLSQQGGGSIGAPVVSFTASSINFIIPAGAATGQVTVTVGTQSAVSGASLSVVPSSAFSISAGPASGSLQQGTSTSYSVSLTSSNGFAQLASLSLSGLPSGLTAKFSPTQITAGSTSILTITAPVGQALGNATLTISAAATVDGISTTQSASVGLSVLAASTSLIGRTVESDSNETPIPGITITMLGVDDAGNHTGCSGQTRSDAAGNFAFTNLGTSCLGRQLVGYDGNTATDGEKYAGVNLAYTMNAGQITGPELVHMPTISDAETIMVKQNATVDQVFSYATIPGITVTVYAGTTLTLPDGTQPDPFPMAAVLVPVDRLPDAPSPTTGTLRASIVAFQPANTTSSLPVSVTFPNVVNTPPGVNMELDTLDPIVGELVKYGTGTVSSDASEIIPDPDPAHPGHRFGISHFDWHGPMAPAPNGNNPCPNPPCQDGGDPVDLSSGLLTFTKRDMVFGGARGQVPIERTYRTLSGAPGPFGIGTNHNYGYQLDVSNLFRGTGRFVTLVMPDGNQFQFAQQGTNIFTNSTIPALLGAVITSPSSGLYTLRWKDGSLFTFHTIGGPLLAFLTAITDANGNAITLLHGNSNAPVQITQISDAIGRTLNLTYDNFSRILSIADPIGRTVQYTYNSQGTLATVTDPAGGVTAYGYDPQNRMTTITDPRNILYLQNVYDANGRVTQQTTANNGVTTFNYTLLNPTVSTSPVLMTTVTDPRGNSTTYHFNPQGFLVDVTDPLGEKTIYTLDAGTSQVTGVTDPLGRTTAFTYDAIGNLTSATFLAGTSSAVTTTFAYDPTFGKITSIKNPLGQTTSMSYDTRGNLTSTTDPLGHSTHFDYDSTGELTSITDAVGNIAKFTYSNGDLVSVVDPVDNTTTYSTDAVGRLLSTTTALGQTTSYAYDPLNAVSQVTNASGGKITFSHDANGNLTSVADPLGQTTQYSYDVMDRLAGRTDALLRQQTYQYDLNGNLTQATDRSGKVTKYQYDSLNRRTFVGFAANGATFESTISTTYDGGNRLISLQDSAGGSVSETYDNLDHLVKEVTPFGSVSYAYDVAGRRTSMTVAGQTPVSYVYDAADRLTSLAQGAASVSFAYDDANRRLSLTLPNGVKGTYSYDQNSRLTAIRYASGTNTLGDLSYTYDALGRRTAIGGSFARTNVPQAIPSATYDAANELTNWNGTAITYDANGNMLSDGQHTLTWNARGQLASVNGLSPEYDAWGRRVKNPQGTSYILDGANPVQELSGTTSVATLLTGGTDEIFSRSDSNGTFVPITDSLGSVFALTDSTGAPKTQYTFEPFGNTTVTGATNANPTQYTGRDDDNTGFYFYRSRYYSPTFGRFISEDPLDILGGDLDLYVYVGNDPLRFVDPSGLDWLDNASDFIAGAGDSLTFGGTAVIRRLINGGDDPANHCSGWYKGGEYTEVGVEIALTLGAGALKTAAKEASRDVVRREAAKLIEEQAIREDGKIVHHINPLFGHPPVKGGPGWAPALFPTGGLPAWIHSGAWNLKALTPEEHAAAHAAARAAEDLATKVVNPATTGARLLRNALGGRKCH